MTTITPAQNANSATWYTPEPNGYVAHRRKTRAPLRTVTRPPAARAVRRYPTAKAVPLTGRALIYAEIAGWNATPCADL